MFDFLLLVMTLGTGMFLGSIVTVAVATALETRVAPVFDMTPPPLFQTDHPQPTPLIKHSSMSDRPKNRRPDKNLVPGPDHLYI